MNATFKVRESEFKGEIGMTIRGIIENTKKIESNLNGILVIIQDKNKLTFMGNPTELYCGELIEIPEKYMDCEIIEKSTICAASDESNVGANVLTISLN